MNLLQDLSIYRLKQPLLSLIPIDFCMAWPMGLENDRWYLPLFTMKRSEKGYLCKKEAEIVFTYPDFELYYYRRCEKKIQVYAPLSGLSDWAEEIYNWDILQDRLSWTQLFLDKLPDEFQPFYPIKKEGEAYDYSSNQL